MSIRCEDCGAAAGHGHELAHTSTCATKIINDAMTLHNPRTQGGKADMVCNHCGKVTHWYKEWRDEVGILIIDNKFYCHDCLSVIAHSAIDHYTDKGRVEIKDVDCCNHCGHVRLNSETPVKESSKYIKLYMIQNSTNVYCYFCLKMLGHRGVDI